MLLLYAVVPATHTVPSATDVDADLELVRGDRVGVLCEQRDETPAADRAALLAFGGVLTRLVKDGPALPVRFGTVLPEEDDLRALLREREEQWASRLEAVAGHAEVIVHVADEDVAAAPASTAATGRDYLMSRAAAVHRREAVEEGLAAAVGPRCREVRQLRSSNGLRLACLVSYDGLDDLTGTLEGWAATEPGRRVITSGPWPPFSFTEEEAPE